MSEQMSDYPQFMMTLRKRGWGSSGISVFLCDFFFLQEPCRRSNAGFAKLQGHCGFCVFVTVNMYKELRLGFDNVQDCQIRSLPNFALLLEVWCIYLILLLII